MKARATTAQKLFYLSSLLHGGADEPGDVFIGGRAQQLRALPHLHQTAVAHDRHTVAKQNGIDHIVIGARGASAMRRHLGSVSSKVVAQAECSVTVVRLSK